jgi:hypothetical protein
MQDGGFKEVRSRKRRTTEEITHTLKKAAPSTTRVDNKKFRNEVPSRNFFAPS